MLPWHPSDIPIMPLFPHLSPRRPSATDCGYRPCFICSINTGSGMEESLQYLSNEVQTILERAFVSCVLHDTQTAISIKNLRKALTHTLSSTDVAKVRDYENYAETKTFCLEKAIGKKNTSAWWSSMTKQRRLLFERQVFMLKTQNSQLILPLKNCLQKLGSRKYFSLLQKNLSKYIHTRIRSH